MDIHFIYGFFMKKFRPARANAIAESFPLLFDTNSRVLDIGGGKFPWEDIKPTAHIVCVNIGKPHSIPQRCSWEFIDADGTNLPFPDASFDLVFSNSVIEHVGDAAQQRRFANEMLRVGKKIYFQTPNKWFPVEPHLIGIFIHWLPFSVARKLIRYFTIWGLVNKPDQKVIDDFIGSINLLAKSEVIDLFPNCELLNERFLGLTKSFIVRKC
jgi:SAM-dependent methyltransferase